MPVQTRIASGLNFTGALFATESDKVYYQVLFGQGVGSYRELPDAAPSAVDALAMVGSFGWMLGWTHDWSDSFSSNFTYSESRIENTLGQAMTDLHANNYLAVNFIWNPADRLFAGVEYLYGTRKNISGALAAAHRLQMSFGFYLP